MSVSSEGNALYPVLFSYYMASLKVTVPIVTDVTVVWLVCLSVTLVYPAKAAGCHLAETFM